VGLVGQPVGGHLVVHVNVCTLIQQHALQGTHRKVVVGLIGQPVGGHLVVHVNVCTFELPGLTYA